MRLPGPAAIVLVAAATVAAPLATARAAAQDAGWTGPVIKLHQKQVWLSPNQDKAQDKARLSFNLDKTAKVTVKVRRNDKTRPLVYREKLGKLPAGLHHRWTWKGKSSDGNVVRDGKYSAVFVADQVGKDGKKRIRSATLWVDTKFNTVEAPTLSLDTVYPRTTQFHDALGVTLTGKGKLASVSAAVLRVRDGQGRLVRRISGGTDWWYKSFTLPFDGRDEAGTPLAGGTYTIRAQLVDRAGNRGRSRRVTVNVADEPLVERTGTVVVPPTGSWKASEVLSGTAPAASTPSPGASGSQPYPCGRVVPSEVYANAGAQSFRSDDTCTGSFAVNAAYARGTLLLDDLTAETAPRGGPYSARVSMRGRPTEPTETDTATLTLGGPVFGFNGVVETPRGASSPAVAAETVTSTETVTTAPPALPYYSRPTQTQPPTLDWTIVTRGTDSFDVAGVTVHYTYLTPHRRSPS